MRRFYTRHDLRRGRSRSTWGAVITIAMLACSNRAFAQAGSAPLQPCVDLPGPKISTQRISLPEVSGEHEVEVGESLLSTAQQSVYEQKLIVSGEASFTGKHAGAEFTVTIPAEDIAAVQQRGVKYKMAHASFRYLRESGERHGISKPDIFVYLDDAGSNVPVARVSFGLSSNEYSLPTAHVEQMRCVALGMEGFQHEILYSGSAKGVLTLTYREFTNQLARPAFSQEINYDLAAGNEIGLKGARIKIIKISNTGLRYLVLRPLE